MFRPSSSLTTKIRACTLIELLCVSGVIAFLAAIIVPVFARAKAQAKVSICQSNLRQLAAAFQAYAADWSDTYPCTGDPYLWMGRRWRWPVKRHIALAAHRDPDDPANPNKSVGPRRSVLLCPADTEAPNKWDATSYAYSASFYHSPEQINSMTTEQLFDAKSPGPPCAPQKVSDVLRPSKKALLGEWVSNHSAERTNWWDPERRGARNYSFADGHVALVPAARIGPTVTDLPDVNLTRDGVRGTDIP